MVKTKIETMLRLESLEKNQGLYLTSQFDLELGIFW